MNGKKNNAELLPAPSQEEQEKWIKLNTFYCLPFHLSLTMERCMGNRANDVPQCRNCSGPQSVKPAEEKKESVLADKISIISGHGTRPNLTAHSAKPSAFEKKTKISTAEKNRKDTSMPIEDKKPFTPDGKKEPLTQVKEIYILTLNFLSSDGELLRWLQRISQKERRSVDQQIFKILEEKMDEIPLKYEPET